MNSRIAPKLISLFSAVLVTIMMLVSVNGLATGEPSAAQVARAAASAPSV